MGNHTDSPWSHSICDDCWFQRNIVKRGEDGRALEIRAPHRVGTVETAEGIGTREWDQCCFCGSATYSGIFVRHDPKSDEVAYYCTSGIEERRRRTDLINWKPRSRG